MFDDPINMIYVNSRKKVLDYCEPYYTNETFTRIPEEMRGTVRTVQVLKTVNDKDIDTLIYDYKVYSRDISLLRKIEEGCSEISLRLEIENGPIKIFSQIIGDTLDITFIFTHTSENKTYRSIKEFNETILEIGGNKIKMHCHIKACCKEHKEDLTDLIITTNLFRAIGFNVNLISTFSAIFYPNSEGKLGREDYIALAVILGKTLNSEVCTNIVIKENAEVELERVLETYCDLNKEVPSKYIEYRISSLLNVEEKI